MMAFDAPLFDEEFDPQSDVTMWERLSEDARTLVDQIALILIDPDAEDELSPAERDYIKKSLPITKSAATQAHRLLHAAKHAGIDPLRTLVGYAASVVCNASGGYVDGEMVASVFLTVLGFLRAEEIRKPEELLA